MTRAYWAVDGAGDLDQAQSFDPATIPAAAGGLGVQALPGVPLRPTAPLVAPGGGVARIPLPTGTVPTIGIDPGSKWTAAVLRVGNAAITGWTLGPVDRLGRPDRHALNNPDDWPAFSRYTNRLISHLEELVAYAEAVYGAVRIAIEIAVVPSGWQPTGGGKNRLPLADVLLPRMIAAAVLGAFPDARLVPPDKYGSRAAEVPAELRGRRPAHFGPNETPRGERDHEQAAWHVAGVGAEQP